MVALDEGRTGEGEAPRIPPGRRGRAAACHPRQRLGGVAPYATGRTIVVLAPNGSRRFSFTASDPVVYLSAHSRGYAAVLENGSVLTFSTAGRLIRERTFAPGAVQAAVLAAPGLIVKTAAGLEIHSAAPTQNYPLPRNARFLGYSQGLVAYGLGRELRLRQLKNGHDTLFRTLEPRFHAQLGRRGLAYASGRKLGFSVWAIVNAAF